MGARVYHAVAFTSALIQLESEWFPKNERARQLAIHSRPPISAISQACQSPAKTVSRPWTTGRNENSLESRVVEVPAYSNEKQRPVKAPDRLNR